MTSAGRSLAWLEALDEHSLNTLLSQSSVVILRPEETLEENAQQFGFLRSGALILEESDGTRTLVSEQSSWFTTPIFISGGIVQRARAERDSEILLISRAAFSTALSAAADHLALAGEPQLRRNTMLASALSASLHGATALATPIDVAITLQQIQDSNAISFATLADVLGRDPAVVATLLYSANSNLFGGRDPVRTLPQAIARLGLRATRSLSLGISIFNLYKARDPKIRRALHRIWSESVEIAALAYQLARDIAGVEADSAMLAGLLHRMGALPLLQLMDQRDITISEDDLQFTLQAAESIEALRLAHHWQQSATIVSAVTSHTWRERHSPAIDCSDVVHLACLIRTIEMGYCVSPDAIASSRWQRVAAQVNHAQLPATLQNALSTGEAPTSSAVSVTGVNL